MVPHVFGRPPFAPGNLTAASAPVRIEAPEEADERHEAAFDHRNACVREALEDAVAEDRDQVAVHARAAESVVLDVVVGHAGGGDRDADADALEVRVYGNRKRQFVGSVPE